MSRIALAFACLACAGLAESPDPQAKLARFLLASHPAAAFNNVPSGSSVQKVDRRALLSQSVAGAAGLMAAALAPDAAKATLPPGYPPKPKAVWERRPGFTQKGMNGYFARKGCKVTAKKENNCKDGAALFPWGKDLGAKKQ
mmetsp:Transcript_139573/g.267544  ORF Transcript_139573/g.267544 Transcript_139573/m.267544 type:complete len:142 (-) Transcript_139573:171-596(-)